MVYLWNQRAHSVLTGFLFTVVNFLSGGADEVSRWWAGVVIVARSWLTGEKIPSESVYVIVDEFPKMLKNER